MSEYIRAALPTGNTYYAKPLPVDADPTWTDDVVALTESGTVAALYESASIADPADEYAIFLQAGGSPADTDTLKAVVEMSSHRLDAILEDTAETFYQAAVHVERKASVDEYTVAVLQNGQLFTGSITSCSLAMVKRADGTELFSATARTAVDDGLYKLDKTATRTAADTGYIAVVTVVIAGVTYTLAAPVHTSA